MALTPFLELEHVVKNAGLSNVRCWPKVSVSQCRTRTRECRQKITIKDKERRAARKGRGSGSSSKRGGRTKPNTVTTETHTYSNRQHGKTRPRTNSMRSVWRCCVPKGWVFEQGTSQTGKPRFMGPRRWVCREKQTFGALNL